MDGVAAIGPCLAAWSVVRLSVVRPLGISFIIFGISSSSGYLLRYHRHNPPVPCPSVRVGLAGWRSSASRRVGRRCRDFPLSSWRGGGGDVVPASETGCDHSLPFRSWCLCRPSRRHVRAGHAVSSGGVVVIGGGRRRRRGLGLRSHHHHLSLRPRDVRDRALTILLFRLASSSLSVAVVGVCVGLDAPRVGQRFRPC